MLVTRHFSGVLDAWLGSQGLARPTQPRERVAGQKLLRLRRWAVEVADAVRIAPGGPARGLQIARHVRLEHGGPLGYMLLNTRNLADLLATYVLLEKWFYSQNWAQLTSSDTDTTLSWDARFGRPERLLEQLHVMALVHIVRQLCPTGGSLVAATMINPAMGEEGAYRRAFGCAVRFGRPVTSISFPASAMQAPVGILHGDLGLPWRTRQRTLHRLPSASLFVGAVCEAILQTLPAGAPTDRVAERLNLSRRTFQRRLTESGCSFRQLLDGVRERYARELLKDDSLTRREVAFLLGYSEQSALNHAVARWTPSTAESPAR